VPINVTASAAVMPLSGLHLGPILRKLPAPSFLLAEGVLPTYVGSNNYSKKKNTDFRQIKKTNIFSSHFNLDTKNTHTTMSINLNYI
jgi:hypothetical protein